MALTHLAGNHLLSTLTRWACGTHVTDVHCGLRSFARHTLVHIPAAGGGMEFATQMVTHAHKTGLRIAETPIDLRPAPTGRRSHLRPVRDGLRHVVAIFRAISRDP